MLCNELISPRVKSTNKQIKRFKRVSSLFTKLPTFTSILQHYYRTELPNTLRKKQVIILHQGISVLCNPAYSTDFVGCDFSLFSTVDSAIKGKRRQVMKYIQKIIYL